MAFPIEPRDELSCGARMLGYWRYERTVVNAAASDEDIAVFEIRYGISLPSCFRDCLAAANGMADDGWDSDWIRFWPIQEIAPITEFSLEYAAKPGYRHRHPESFFVFADFLIHSHFYIIRIAPGVEDHGSVSILAGHEPLRLSGSFEEFVDLYVTKDRHLWGPERNRAAHTRIVHPTLSWFRRLFGRAGR